MCEITEDEAFAMASDSDCPVLGKEESDAMEAAVCLKKFPQGFILGVSDKVQDLRLWFTTDQSLAEERYRYYVTQLREFGTPIAVRR